MCPQEGGKAKLMQLLKYLVLCSCAVASPAAAHWQFTRWGMNPEQVIAASNGTARHAELSPEVRESFRRVGVGDWVEGSYSAGGRDFEVKYRFDGQGLQTVLLSHAEEDGSAGCSRLRDDLLGSYGSPLEERRGVTTWVDRRAGNRISYTSLGIGTCYVMYSRLTATGL